MTTDPRIEVARAGLIAHLWRPSLHKCKCGWKPAPDTNIAIEISRHQITEQLAHIDRAATSEQAEHDGAT